MHDCVVREVGLIDRSFRNKKLELKDLLQAQPRLRELKSADTTTQQVAAAIEEAHNTLSKLQYLSARYHIFKLTIACHELDDLDAEIDKAGKRMQRYLGELSQVRTEIKRGGRWVSKVLRRVDEFERVRLNDEEERILSLIAQCQVALSRDTVDRWLDSMVDIQLDDTAGRMALRRIEEAMQRFATVIGRFTGDVRGENIESPVVSFCDDAEAYVIRYFKSKRVELESEPESVRRRLENVRNQVLNHVRAARGAQRKSGRA